MGCMFEELISDVIVTWCRLSEREEGCVGGMVCAWWNGLRLLSEDVLEPVIDFSMSASRYVSVNLVNVRRL